MTPMEGVKDVVRLIGKVERVIYRQDRYTVFRLSGVPYPVVGEFPPLSPGQEVEVVGEWVIHPRFGRQLRGRLGGGEDLGFGLGGAVTFLAEHIPWMGYARAKALVQSAPLPEGMTTENLLRLGLSPHQVADALLAWEKKRPLYEGVVSLYDLGLTPGQVDRILRHYGESLDPRAIRENPYLLTEVEGIGFLTADAAFLRSGGRPDDPRRLKAAAQYVMRALLEEGHTAPRRERVLSKGPGLGLSPQDLERGLASEVEVVGPIGDKRLTLPWVRRIEEAIAHKALAQCAVRRTPIRPPEDVHLTPEQAALFPLLENPLVILTGGPGTGKTYTVSALVRSLRASGVTFALAAPTGKAARRISEMSRHEAQTVHRLLGYRPEGGFTYGPDCPLPYEVVVVDESSMMDIFLAHALVQAIRPGATLLLVGDVDQLPPVGPGQPFADLIASGCPTVRLTVVQRQALDNPIVRAAHEVNGGRFPTFPGDEGDERLTFTPLESPDPDVVVRMALSIRDRYGVLPQVLTPMRRGPLGTRELNARLKAAVNPGSGSGVPVADGAVAHVGDLLIQTRNNYDIGLMNGEQGTVEAIDPEAQVLYLNTAQGLVRVPVEFAKDLALAYAITVHKSQGSEWRHVVLVLHTSHYVMLTREMVYTGLTRARETCHVVGSVKALAIAVSRLGARRETYMSLLSEGKHG